MKWLFYLLALTNSGVLALQYWYLPAGQPAAELAAEPSASGGPGLVLVSELEQAPQPRQAEVRPAARPQPMPEETAPVTAPSPSPAPVCYRIYGLPDDAQADKLAARLRRAGGEIRGRHLEQVKKTNYWVLLPPAPSRAKALATLRRLNRAGITDHYLITDGPNRYGISLGLFSNPDGADRRRTRVARLGLGPTIEPIQRPAKAYALTLAVTGGRSVRDFDLGSWADNLKETACP